MPPLNPLQQSVALALALALTIFILQVDKYFNDQKMSNIYILLIHFLILKYLILFQF